MIKTDKIRIYPIILIGFSLIITNSCSLFGTKENPVITWENPEDISYGTLLGEEQLNATSNIVGAFYYTPDVGTLLDKGANRDLKVDFIPLDSKTYNDANKTVKINVLDVTIIGGKSSAVFNPGKTYGTLTDIDGNVYKTITIGTQTWMAENLGTAHYRNGDPIPTGSYAWNVGTEGAYLNYNNTTDKDIIATYGRLYNGYAVFDSRNIAPVGWHIPNYAEWLTLITYLGGLDIAGDKLKETGTAHWQSPNTGADNSSGFTALPGGDHGIFDFELIGWRGYWWSSTEKGTGDTYFWDLNYDYSGISSIYSSKGFGLSIRCIKD